MSDLVGQICDRGRHERRAKFRLGAGEWLGFAATPSFAFMALLSSAHAGGPADLFCSASHGTPPFGGMMPMYGLMSAFHSEPWVKLISGRRVHQPKIEVVPENWTGG